MKWRRDSFPILCVLVVLSGLCPPARAEEGAAATPAAGRTPVLPPVTVSGAALDEERLVGKNKQPEWTTERRFAASRAYVLPAGMVELEQWWRGTYKRGGAEAHRFLSEIGVGLPGRWQLDLYGRLQSETGSSTRYLGEQLEARYALADWGRLPGNPTFYLEWKNNHHGPDVLEGKLLLADGLRNGIHWAVNFSYEEETGGAREIERAFTFAVSKAVRDSRFGAGIEGVLEHVSSHGASNETAFLIGPSFQWRPNRRMHVDFVPLFGTTRDAPHTQIFVVVGYGFGDKAKESGGPVSSKSR